MSARPFLSVCLCALVALTPARHRVDPGHDAHSVLAQLDVPIARNMAYACLCCASGDGVLLSAYECLCETCVVVPAHECACVGGWVRTHVGGWLGGCVALTGRIDYITALDIILVYLCLRSERYVRRCFF